MKSLVKLLTSTSIYTLTTLLNQLFSLLLLFILTRYLKPWEYGILVTFQAIYPLTQILIDGGSTFAVSREWFDRSHFGLYLFNAFFLKGLVFLGILFLCILLHPFLSQLFKIPTWLIFCIPVLSYLSAMIDMITRLWISQKKSIRFGWVHSSRIVMNFGLAFIIIVFMDGGWEGRIAGLILTEIGFASLVFWFLLREFSFSLTTGIRLSDLKHMVILGGSSFLLSINHWVINLSDRLLINRFQDPIQTGIYSVGYSLGSLLEFFSGAFSIAFMPFFIEKLKNISEEQKNTLVKYTYAYFGILFFMALLWIEISPFLVHGLVGTHYHDAIQYIPWVTFAYFFRSLFRMFSLYIVYTKRMQFLLYPSLLSSMINVFLNLFLIPRNGAMGAAQATLVSFAFEAAMVFFYAQKGYPMPWFTFLRRSTYESHPERNEVKQRIS